MTSNLHRLLRAGLLIVVFVLLLATAYLAGLGNMRQLRQDGYNAGYEAALEDRGFAPITGAPAVEKPQTAIVSGTVTAVTADTFTITEEVPGSTEPGPTRSVTLASGGSVIGITPKDPAVLERELAAYNRARQRNSDSTDPLPAPEEQRTIMLVDLRVGDRVSIVTLAADADPISAQRITRTAVAPQ